MIVSTNILTMTIAKVLAILNNASSSISSDASSTGDYLDISIILGFIDIS